MCKLLMSIKPEYVNEILSGRKKYEYRTKKAKRDNIDKIVIYCTAPIMKVVAEIEIMDIIENTPEQIWRFTKFESGISKEKFDKYFLNKSLAVAYKLGKIKIYEHPKKLADIGVSHTPQSFIYLD